MNYAEELNNPKLQSIEIINQAKNKVIAGLYIGTPDLKIESVQNGNWVKYSGTFYAVGFTADDGDHCVLRIAFKNDLPEFSSWISEVKVELGTVATPFIPDDPATNLAKCQRYYQKSFPPYLSPPTPWAGQYFVTTCDHLSFGMVNFPVVMRATPTLTMYDVNGHAGMMTEWGVADVAANPSFVNETGFMPQKTGGGANNGRFYVINYTADAEL